MVQERNVSPEMLKIIFHDGGIVYGDCLRFFLLNEKVDDKTFVSVITSLRLFKILRNKFRDEYLFCDWPREYDLKNYTILLNRC